MEEDNGTILCSPIRALPVHLGRVVQLKKQIEQRCIAHLLRIEGQLHHLNVAGAVRAHVLVCGVLERPAFITHRGFHDSRHLLEACLHTPEAARSKCCFFHDLLPFHSMRWLPFAAHALRATTFRYPSSCSPCHRQMPLFHLAQSSRWLRSLLARPPRTFQRRHLAWLQLTHLARRY